MNSPQPLLRNLEDPHEAEEADEGDVDGEVVHPAERRDGDVEHVPTAVRTQAAKSANQNK